MGPRGLAEGNPTRPRTEIDHGMGKPRAMTRSCCDRNPDATDRGIEPAHGAIVGYPVAGVRCLVHALSLGCTEARVTSRKRKRAVTELPKEPSDEGRCRGRPHPLCVHMRRQPAATRLLPAIEAGRRGEERPRPYVRSRT